MKEQLSYLDQIAKNKIENLQISPETNWESFAANNNISPKSSFSQFASTLKFKVGIVATSLIAIFSLSFVFSNYFGKKQKTVQATSVKIKKSEELRNEREIFVQKDDELEKTEKIVKNENNVAQNTTNQQVDENKVSGVSNSETDVAETENKAENTTPVVVRQTRVVVDTVPKNK